MEVKSMFVTFDTKIGNKEMFNDFLTSGKGIFSKNQKDVHNTLEEYLLNDEIIDGDAISQDWFPNTNSNIFISHSHLDEEYVIAFAGWLKKNFNLNAFIDSCVWGYSNELLKQIDERYCKNHDATYNYEKRNISTSHVHMMLNVALMKMMDKCECIFFMDTPNSLPVADNIKNTESTLSSWIYSEVEMTRYLREKKPQRKGYRYPINAGFQLEHSELKIKYQINKEHMKKINDKSLEVWLTSCSDHEHPLDTLYKQVNKIEENEYGK